MTAKHGGKRPGSGRKTGSGSFGEPTVAVRVPVSQKGAISNFLEQIKKNHPEARLPETSLGILQPAQGFIPLHLPLFGHRIPAGFPSPADDYIEDRLDLNEYLVQHKEATFFLKVTGHSMVGAGINDGDLLVVDRSLEPAHGAIVIAAVDGELTVKRLSLTKGKIFLVAENPDYPPIEVKEGQEMMIWGVVTNAIHKVQ